MKSGLKYQLRPPCWERSCTKNTALSAWMAGILSGSTDEVLLLLLFCRAFIALAAEAPACGCIRPNSLCSVDDVIFTKNIVDGRLIGG